MKTTENFYTALLSRQSGERVPIKFRSGVKFNLSWSQFVLFRDNNNAMKKFLIQQIDKDWFKICNANLDYAGSAYEISFILKVSQNCLIEQIGKEDFRVKNEKFELVGSYVSSGLLLLVIEYLNGDYACDCNGKIVLDVGGFQGETAVFFSLMGAKKVIIYEPVGKHIQFIMQNIKTNNVNAEIHEQGIGDINEVRTVYYETPNVGFGFDGVGSNNMQIKIRNATEIIDQSGAEIAKFDCEGGEKSLINVPSSTLRKIRLYMIETHSSEIKNALVKKFVNSGFNVTRDTQRDSCSLVYFERRKPCSMTETITKT